MLGEWCYIKKTKKKIGTKKLGRIGNKWESNKISVLKVTVYIAARETIHSSITLKNEMFTRSVAFRRHFSKFGSAVQLPDRGFL